ncbi:MAG: hypothetical protein ABSG21_01255 [Spirochaetia bacterium]|jgi:hypothetical protein
MSFRLKEGIFRVKCRELGCSFNTDITVKENIMGATEADVDSEALRIARNLGYIKHDALFGRMHPLANPEVFKIHGSYEHLGPGPEAPAATPGAASVEAPQVIPPSAPPAPPVAPKPAIVAAKKAKKAAPPRKKPVTKKKPAARKKIVIKKKPASKKKPPAKKKVARKKLAAKRKPAARKKTSARKR